MRELTDGRGADLVFDFVGTDQTHADSARDARPRRDVLGDRLRRHDLDPVGRARRRTSTGRRQPRRHLDRPLGAAAAARGRQVTLKTETHPLDSVNDVLDEAARRRGHRPRRARPRWLVHCGRLAPREHPRESRPAEGGSSVPQGRGQLRRQSPARGALRVTFVRSPLAHARILGIDKSAAEALPNVQVFTAADLDLPPSPAALPRARRGIERPFMATTRVRFVGDIVAVVVPTTAPRARTPPSSSSSTTTRCRWCRPDAALDDEVLLFPERRHECLRARSGAGARRAPVRRLRGRGVGHADQPAAGAGPLEPRSAAAVVGEDGRLTAWISTQTPHQDRDGLARISASTRAVRVVAPGRRRRLRREGAQRRGHARRLARAQARPARALDRDAQREHGRAAPRPRRSASTSRSAARATATCRRTGSRSSRTPAPTRASARSCRT